MGGQRHLVTRAALHITRTVTLGGRLGWGRNCFLFSFSTMRLVDQVNRIKIVLNIIKSLSAANGGNGEQAAAAWSGTNNSAKNAAFSFSVV